MNKEAEAMTVRVSILSCVSHVLFSHLFQTRRMTWYGPITEDQGDLAHNSMPKTHKLLFIFK